MQRERLLNSKYLYPWVKYAIMPETIFNQRIIEDLTFLKEKILRIEIEISEINDDLHQVRPDYLKKLKKIDQGKFISRAEFEKELAD